MPDRSWAALGKKIDARWAPEREDQARHAVARRTTRRRLTMRIGAAMAILTVVAGGARVLVRAHARSPSDLAIHASPSSTSSTVTGAAAVVVTPLSRETVVDALPDRGGRAYSLRQGGARFVVAHDAAHPCVVTARGVAIEDIGTTFTVAYAGTDRLEVVVDEGRVRVRGPSADVVEIGGGERHEVVLEPAAVGDAGTPEASSSSPPAAASVALAWRSLAENGRYDEAYTALNKSGASAVRDETGELLLAADAARLSGHPAESVPYLQRIARSHSGDPRAGLAAFTLGRVLLEELGRPAEAADAFARARAGGGPLAEDALAREVEAYSRSGDLARSRELAREYLRLYPNGRRSKAVTKFGGVE